MNYAIQSETRHYPYLEVSARKRALKHSLIRVEQGLLLFRLGKHEYAVEKGQTLWIPFDCLCGLTFFPDTHITRVDFSLRLNVRLPHNAGFIKSSELALAVLHRLQNCERHHPAFTHLTQLLMLELTTCDPKLKMSPLTQAITECNRKRIRVSAKNSMWCCWCVKRSNAPNPALRHSALSRNCFPAMPNIITSFVR